LKITIITVCFNVKKTIPQCINSVLSQDFKDYEYIIIDGFSTDGTREIIQEYGSKISKVISEPDGGIYEAMNKGLALAQGDWILFLNSDDKLHESNTLSRVANYLTNIERNYYGVAEIVHDNLSLCRKPAQLTPINFDNDLPIHQTVFISRLYKSKKFSTQYKISADSVYLFELSRSTQFDLIPVCVVFFNLGGVSSWYPNFNKYITHLREHLNFLRIKKSSSKLKIYTFIAFTLKFFLSKILSPSFYFKIIAYVAQLKARL
jgi:glycosyltransferase involved in cell wall biosynthesis